MSRGYSGTARLVGAKGGVAVLLKCCCPRGQGITKVREALLSPGGGARGRNSIILNLILLLSSKIMLHHLYEEVGKILV